MKSESMLKTCSLNIITGERKIIYNRKSRWYSKTRNQNNYKAENEKQENGTVIYINKLLTKRI